MFNWGRVNMDGKSTQTHRDLRLMTKMLMHDRAYVPQADVLFLSFPKSGRTWVRLMLSVYFSDRYDLKTDEIIEYRNFTKMNGNIPFIYFTHQYKSGHPYIASSFEKRVESLPVIYMMRHPIDNAVSGYYSRIHRAFMKKQDALEMSKYEWIAERGLPRIVEYMNFWEDQLRHVSNLHVTTYEKCLSNPGAELAAMLRFVGEEPDLDVVARVVEKTSFKKVRSMEEDGTLSGARFGAARKNDSNSFKARRGKAGGYMDEFEPEQIEALEGYLKAECRVDYMLRPQAQSKQGQAVGG